MEEKQIDKSYINNHSSNSDIIFLENKVLVETVQ